MTRAKCLCIDLEVSRDSPPRLLALGAYRPDLGADGVRLLVRGHESRLLEDLDAITQGASFVLGHNVASFDQPILQGLLPQAALHALPLLDTLSLSPVAFPQNPYHRLVKDYKLHTTRRNDPVADAELAYSLFLDQREALKERQQQHPDEVLCLHFLVGARRR